MSNHWMRQWNFIGIGLGVAVWITAALLHFAGATSLDSVQLLLLGGIAVIAPLALWLTAEPSRDGRFARPYVLGIFLQPIATILASLSLLLPTGLLAAAFASSWLLLTIVFAIWGLVRLLPRSLTTIDELCIDMGLL